MTLVVVDQLTKMAHFITCAKVADRGHRADLFLAEVVWLHGLPDMVFSNQGLQFMSLFWHQLHKLGSTRVNLSSGFHLETNGQTEHTNQILEQYLRCYFKYDQCNWLAWLLLAEFAYNNAIQESAGMWLFKSNVGYQPWFSYMQPADAVVPVAEDWAKALIDRVACLLSGEFGEGAGIVQAAHRFITEDSATLVCEGQGLASACKHQDIGAIPKA